MNKIFMFGGSYAEASDNPISWVYRLSNNYNVVNLSKANRSNAEMYLDLLSVKEQLTPSDIIIVVWNDFLFPYIKDLKKIKNKHEVVDLYLKYFYHEKLNEEHYKFYLNSFKSIAEEKKLKLIALWALPSNYVESSIWPWKQDHHLNYKEHTYLVEFPNDIRPSLVYYSKTELKKMNLSDKEKYYADDPRPNHIENKDTHDNIYNAICEVINNNVSGIIHLPV